MVNKLTITVLGLGSLLIGLVVWQFQVQAGVGVSTTTENGMEHKNSNEPAQTPAIQDALILEGWNTLRGLQDPIQVGNGVVLSGEALAQFLLDNQIPVVWGSEAICGGSSCSRLYCGQDGKCSYEDGQPGIDPIYLNPAIHAQSVGMRDRLMGELAHEAFHRMRPFSAGTITQLEEYWAFYVNTQLVKASFPKFDNVDPMDPEQLEHWFYVNGLHGYLHLAPYPGGAAQAPRVEQVSQASTSEPLETGIAQ